MADDKTSSRRHRGTIALLLAAAVVWLGMAAWAITRGSPIEAAGHVVVVVQAILVAVLIADLSRPRTTQLRLAVAALVPVALALFILSIFL